MRDATTNGDDGKIYDVVILLYPGLTLLDAIGPNEVLSNSGRFKVTFASKDGQPVANDHENLRLGNLRSIQEIQAADILLIPGGPGDVSAMDDAEVLEWVAAINETTRYTTSVCTGSLILAKAGLLAGRKACTYWAYLAELEELGARPVRKRFVQDGKFITSAGVSAGIDMALFLLQTLVGRFHAKEIQFGIEYFPNRYDLFSSHSLPRFLLERLAQRARSVIDASRARIRTRLREGRFGDRTS